MSRRPHACQARQYGDQIVCAACGLNWDANDPEPPQCRAFDARTRRAKATAKFEAEAPPTAHGELPRELPATVAVNLERAYYANGGGIRGMRAAYRLLLDTMEV